VREEGGGLRARRRSPRRPWRLHRQGQRKAEGREVPPPRFWKKEVAMFRFVEVRPYEARRGHRFAFQAEGDVFLLGDEGHLIFVPKGKRVEVSLVDLSPHPGGLEAAVIYGGAFVALRRGLTLTAEEALGEALLEAAPKGVRPSKGLLPEGEEEAA